jgi:hypothetical protein
VKHHHQRDRYAAQSIEFGNVFEWAFH